MTRTSASLLFFLPVIWSHAPQRDSPEIINITSGGWCVLPCPCAPNSTLLRLQWVRPDLKRDGYVFDLRPLLLHPSYRGRVHPRDSHLNGCDVILQNITSNDTGVYECWALHRGTGSATKLTSRHVIQLRVKDLPGGDNRDPRVEEQLPPQRSRYGLICSIGFLTIICLLFICATQTQRYLEVTATDSLLFICTRWTRRYLEVFSNIFQTKPSIPPHPPSPETTILNC
ncbi:uncharacterized protein LOC117382369 [Periophthalmus magnuspinnatus]|uniref:uncharacterized protein LOC117382369 n=1 Tax=Periophthalmus magnuspinnatus TaxID=409849 RepID=UPI00145C0CA3|nr:uncharacterized protein LOC117382369 [Periophthalmus magnuspinnatus]